MTEHKRLSLDDVAKMAAAGHSAFSPSSSKMWLTCSGSLIPHITAYDETSYEAAEGSAAHKLAEIWMAKGRKAAKECVGDTWDIGGHEIPIDDDMFAFVQDYIDYIEEIESSAVEALTETRVDFSDLTPIPDQGGTADFIAIVARRDATGRRIDGLKGLSRGAYKIVVVDLKYGKGVRVVAEGNTQGLLYAYGAWCKFREKYEINEIEIHIAHPRLDGGFTSWTIPVSKLLEFADLVKERAAAAWQWNAPRTASEEGCQWCRIRGTCPALYKHLAEVTSGVFEDDDPIDDEAQRAANETLEDDLGEEPFRPFKPAELSTKALAKVLRYRKLMEQFFNSVEAELLDRAISDEEEIPGWKLVEGRSNRKWPDDEVHIYKRLKRLGLRDGAIYQSTIISPAEAERKLHAKAGLSREQSAKVVNSLAVKPPGSKSLVRNSDRREALPSDADVFLDDEPMEDMKTVKPGDK